MPILLKCRLFMQINASMIKILKGLDNNIKSNILSDKYSQFLVDKIILKSKNLGLLYATSSALMLCIKSYDIYNK